MLDTGYWMLDTGCGMWDAGCGMVEMERAVNGLTRDNKSYRNLEVWQMARAVSVDIHQMTLMKMPKFEMYEEG
jgi:hypothetical protein